MYHHFHIAYCFLYSLILYVFCTYNYNQMERIYFQQFVFSEIVLDSIITLVMQKSSLIFKRPILICTSR